MSDTANTLPTGAVTFLFTDIEGSTRHWEASAEAMREAQEAHDRIIGDAVAAEGGHVFKTVGDAFCVAFGDPHAALRAAVESQRHLLANAWVTDRPILVRMGIHTGTAHTHENDYSGPTLNRVSRLTSAGHGGQVLVSSATHRLVVDELPAGHTLVGLGTHHLKGLDRPEEIYQVVGDGLPGNFGPLRTVEPGTSALADRALTAYQDKRWQEAIELFGQLEGKEQLDAEKQMMLARALWWRGRHDEMTNRLEAAYNKAVADDDHQAGALAAIELAEIHNHAISPDVSRAWERRAERLLEDDTDSVAKAYLIRWQVVRAFESARDLDRALELSRRVMEIARAKGDGNLEALSLQDQGRILVAGGDVVEGMALMDEAMVAAIAGDVNPMTVGRSYCNMLAVCDLVGDVRRAGEWSEAADRWCSENERGAYPGVCRIFKAELLWNRGEWVRAESEVKRASTEVGMLTDVAGEAYYQYGDMRLRVGDDEGAEAAYQEALARGREPVPGYALLLGRRGEREAGIDLLERKLAEPKLTPLDRVRFLPALIQLTLDAGELEKARDAVAELEAVAETANSELYAAHASSGRGRIGLAEGNARDAIDALKTALRAFTQLGLPFEAAKVHAWLAHAYRDDGAGTMAAMELKIARAEFERLGAPDEAEALGELPGTPTS